MSLFKKSKSAVKGYIGSVKGDANAIKSQVKDQFGSVKNFSNSFDQRISDGLDDLLTGATGIRTSKIPEVSAERLATLEKNREERAKKLNAGARKASDTPPKAFTMKYPENFADANDEGGQMQNYIHFRSLERKNAGPNEEVFDIFLYVPEQMTDAVSVSYEAEEKGLLESVISKFLVPGSDDQGIWDQMSQAGKDAMGGGVLKAATGKVANPMKFQLFTGVETREFSYEFVMYPQEPGDSEKIRAICYAFKKCSLPGTVPESAGRIYTFPNEWAIRYHGPMKNWIDFPMVSALKNVEVDYAVEGGARYSDGAPVAVGLKLTFTEIMTLDRDKYDQRVAAQTNVDTNNRETSQEGGSLPDVLNDQRPVELQGASADKKSAAAIKGKTTGLSDRVKKEELRKAGVGT